MFSRSYNATTIRPGTSPKLSLQRRLGHFLWGRIFPVELFEFFDFSKNAKSDLEQSIRACYGVGYPDVGFYGGFQA